MTSASTLGIHLESARLSSVIFDNVSFRECHLSSARFLACSVKRTDFESAELDSADFGFQPMEGALVYDADFSTVRHVTTDHFEGTLGDATTKLPPELKRPLEWPTRKLNPLERARALITAAGKKADA